MSEIITPQEFVSKWSRSELTESASSQEHFIDLCRLLEHGTPAELDPEGSWFTFEYGATKHTGGEGWADVWKNRYFGWEYKGKDRSLDKAFDQLLLYRESLQNPPLLIVSDINRIIIHTNFTNSIKREISIHLDELLIPEKRNILWCAFHDPDELRDPTTAESVTEEAAQKFAHLAEVLRNWGEDSHKVAHFLIRILFCLFAEDIGLLPKNTFTEIVSVQYTKAKMVLEPLKSLFGAMAKGGWFGASKILHFNGGLFEDDMALELPSDALDVLKEVSMLNWSNIEPSILGTLFERSLDPGKRSQLGAHYTSKEDIITVIKPVLMAPLEKEWEQVKKRVSKLAMDDEELSDDVKIIIETELDKFQRKIEEIRVLDPACGSGNFLYVSLKELLDLQKEVISYGNTFGVGMERPSVSPEQLRGIEINTYASELAHATIWIGYIQWLKDNGFGRPSEPILKPIETIENRDAILIQNPGSAPTEPSWPVSDVAIGNPPYLGSQRMRAELGDEYLDELWELYEGRLPGDSDLVCYWFERARKMIEDGHLKRAGFLGTQSIRGGSNRTVLDRICTTGGIFWAESDRPWILEGATVHVSMVGFDNGEEQNKLLDGRQVDSIYPNLRTGVDLTVAESLEENCNLAFQGPVKVGPFDIRSSLAELQLTSPNPDGRSNSDVIKPTLNAADITGVSRNKWIIDFGNRTLEEAALYEAPFEYVKKKVKPIRDQNKNKRRRENWWRLGASASKLKNAKSGLSRMILTPRVSKHRVFIWSDSEVLPSSAVVIITRDDDYFFGILHSRVHELWARNLGTQLREAESGFRYTPSTTFEKYPFPWPPGKEPMESKEVKEISAAAQNLLELRNGWLHPPSDPSKNYSDRTITNLYNEFPEWLRIAHERLDFAVIQAYRWRENISDSEMLEKLMVINKERYELS